MQGMVLAVTFTARDDASVASIVDELKEFFRNEGAPAGMTSYRIARHNEHPTQIFLVEEWTDAEMHRQYVDRPEHHALIARIAAYAAAPANGDTYTVLDAGPMRQQQTP